MDSKHIIKEFRSYVDGFVECCTSDHETHELLKAVDKLIEEQEERIAIMSEGGEYEKRDKETAELVWKIMRWIGENVDLTDDERCLVAKIDQKAFEKY